MTMDFSTWSGVSGDVVNHEVNMGGTTLMRMLTCLGLPREEDGQVELDEFHAKVRAAIDGWGPENPGYPDAAHRDAYGKDGNYYLYWLGELDSMCVSGRHTGDKFVTWF